MDAFSGINNTNNTFTAAATANYKERITYDANGNIKTYLRNGTTTGGTPLSMDNLTYGYNISGGKLVNNRLRHVKDAIGDANYTEDVDNHPDDNYDYDAIGNLTRDTKEGITNISWSVYGKILSVTKASGTITYTYDASGNRISKTFNGKTTWYVRDASGNVMAVYEQRSELNSGHLTQSEVHLYGSSRLGIWNRNQDLVNPPIGEITIFERGKKFFELSNHLGNILVTVSDRKLQVSTGGNTVDYYTADVVSATDSYVGGMDMPGRKMQSTNEYRYSINGQEKTPEIAPNTTTAEFWQYDARIVRRWNVDPVVKEYESPYMAFAGNPIWIVDRNGADTTPVFRGTPASLNTDLKNKNISPWLDLLNFTPSKQLVDAMNKRRGLAQASVQEIGRAENDPTNFDYYSINITQLPHGTSDFQGLFELLRINFRNFVTGSSSLAGYNSSENAKWESANPLGSVMSFDEDIALWQFFGDDASVLTSSHYSDVNGAYWNFTTLKTPWGDWGHPVSGTRQFGVSVNSNKDGTKSYTFFTRAVDRVADNITKLGGLLSSDDVYMMADKTWRNVMTNVSNYINANGGKSEINPVVSQRLSWDKDVKSQYTVPTPCQICGKDINR